MNFSCSESYSKVFSERVRSLLQAFRNHAFLTTLRNTPRGRASGETSRILISFRMRWLIIQTRVLKWSPLDCWTASRSRVSLVQSRKERTGLGASFPARVKNTREFNSILFLDKPVLSTLTSMP
nr:hypothetical protein 1 [Erysiphe necator associated mitovirus 39]